MPPRRPPIGRVNPSLKEPAAFEQTERPLDGAAAHRYQGMIDEVLGTDARHQLRRVGHELLPGRVGH
jgi:hypothetical protein